MGGSVLSSRRLTLTHSRAVGVAMHHRLADVECQLVLQCLDVHSLLAMARCSKRWLQVADSAFAWKCAPLVARGSLYAFGPFHELGVFTRDPPHLHGVAARQCVQFSLMVHWPHIPFAENDRQHMQTLVQVLLARPRCSLELTFSRELWSSDKLRYCFDELKKAGACRLVTRLNAPSTRDDVNGDAGRTVGAFLAACPSIDHVQLSMTHKLPNLQSLRIKSFDLTRLTSAPTMQFFFRCGMEIDASVVHTMAICFMPMCYSEQRVCILKLCTSFLRLSSLRIVESGMPLSTFLEQGFCTALVCHCTSLSSVRLEFPSRPSENAHFDLHQLRRLCIGTTCFVCSATLAQ